MSRTRRLRNNVRRSGTPSLRLEPLEQRLALSATVGYAEADHSIRVTGTEADDVMEVTQQGESIVITVSSVDGVVSEAFEADRVSSIRFDALGGDDTFSNQTSIPSLVFGGAGSDTLQGGSGRDRLFGGDDDDILQGGPGDDVLRGEGGRDSLDGDEGRDWVFGGTDDDLLYGGPGDDKMTGEEGNDEVYGDDGDDLLRGREGDDLLRGMQGRDILRGDEGADRLEGGDDLDWMFGGTGNDLLYGGADNDKMTGEDGDDELHGGDGDDLMRGRRGDDRLYGEAGSDTLYGDEDDDDLDGGLDTDRLIGGIGLDREWDDHDGFEDGDADHDGYDDDHDRAPAVVTPVSQPTAPAAPVGTTPIVFDATGFAQVVGVSQSEADSQRYSFTAASSGDLHVAIFPGSAGRYADLTVRNYSTRRELLELEPHERRGQTGGKIAVTAGQTYVIEVESPYDRLAVDFVFNLKLV